MINRSIIKTIYNGGHEIKQNVGQLVITVQYVYQINLFYVNYISQIQQQTFNHL